MLINFADQTDAVNRYTTLLTEVCTCHCVFLKRWEGGVDAAEWRTTQTVAAERGFQVVSWPIFEMFFFRVALSVLCFVLDIFVVFSASVYVVLFVEFYLLTYLQWGYVWLLVKGHTFFNNNGFICTAARMLDYTISAAHDSAYNVTQIIIWT